MPPKRSGPPYRRTVITFWTDPDVKNVLTRDEKLFLNYLFTNEHSHPCGVYRLGPIIVMDELEFTKTEMRAMLDGPLARFATYDWRTEEVFVHAMADHQIDGNGLHGQDNRIKWVTTQLQMTHSRVLLEQFHGRYMDWNLPWAEILPAPPGGDDVPPDDGFSEGASKGLHKALPKPLNHAEKEGAYQARSQSQLTDPVPEGSIYPPASSGSRTAREPPDASKREAGEREDCDGVKALGRAGPKHPRLDELWSGEGPRCMHVVERVWHQGLARVPLAGGKDVGIGLEYWLFNDLLQRCDRATDDAELAAAMATWLVEEAPHVCGWDDEPRTLYWLLREQNFAVAEGAYLARQVPDRPAEDYGVKVKRIGSEARSA